MSSTNNIKNLMSKILTRKDLNVELEVIDGVGELNVYDKNHIFMESVFVGEVSDTYVKDLVDSFKLFNVVLKVI